MQKIKLSFLIVTILFSHFSFYPNQLSNQEIPKIYDLFPGFFPQANNILKNQPDLEKYKKHCPIYDGFKTIALFDLIKVDDEVLACEEIIRGKHDGLSTEQIRKKIIKKTEKNNNKIIFYVLSDIRSGSKNLASQDSSWSINLQVKDLNLKPRITKLVSNEILEELFDKTLRLEKNKNKVWKFEFELPDKKEFILKKLKNSSLKLTFKSTKFKKDIKFKPNYGKKV